MCIRDRRRTQPTPGTNDDAPVQTFRTESTRQYKQSVPRARVSTSNRYQEHASVQAYGTESTSRYKQRGVSASN
eukprot:3021578-Rhodomonas_salina.2